VDGAINYYLRSTYCECLALLARTIWAYKAIQVGCIPHQFIINHASWLCLFHSIAYWDRAEGTLDGCANAPTTSHLPDTQWKIRSYESIHPLCYWMIALTFDIACMGLPSSSFVSIISLGLDECSSDPSVPLFPVACFIGWLIGLEFNHWLCRKVSRSLMGCASVAFWNPECLGLLNLSLPASLWKCFFTVILVFLGLSLTPGVSQYDFHFINHQSSSHHPAQLPWRYN
jgi:hypothetical protein